VIPLLLAERADRAWRSRCGYGNLGNRTTCACLQCGVWRQRLLSRAAREAATQARRLAVRRDDAALLRRLR